MKEVKKIKIKKNVKQAPANEADAFTAKVGKSLELLEKTVKKVENKYRNFGFYDSKEEAFFEENQGKAVILELINGAKISGTLLGLDRFRIKIDSDGQEKYFFKHAILCYYTG